MSNRGVSRRDSQSLRCWAGLESIFVQLCTPQQSKSMAAVDGRYASIRNRICLRSSAEQSFELHNLWKRPKLVNDDEMGQLCQVRVSQRQSIVCIQLIFFSLFLWISCFFINYTLRIPVAWSVTTSVYLCFFYFKYLVENRYFRSAQPRARRWWMQGNRSRAVLPLTHHQCRIHCESSRVGSGGEQGQRVKWFYSRRLKNSTHGKQSCQKLVNGTWRTSTHSQGKSTNWWKKQNYIPGCCWHLFNWSSGSNTVELRWATKWNFFYSVEPTQSIPELRRG